MPRSHQVNDAAQARLVHRLVAAAIGTGIVIAHQGKKPSTVMSETTPVPLSTFASLCTASSPLRFGAAASARS
jgi:hypothetical protein